VTPAAPAHILVVDDVEKNARLLADVLTARGFRASKALSGEAALAAPVAVWLQSLGFQQKTSAVLATGTVVVSVTYVSIVIGELVPKRLGQHNAENIARLAWPLPDAAAARLTKGEVW